MTGRPHRQHILDPEGHPGERQILAGRQSRVYDRRLPQHGVGVDVHESPQWGPCIDAGENGLGDRNRRRPRLRTAAAMLPAGEVSL